MARSFTEYEDVSTTFPTSFPSFQNTIPSSLHTLTNLPYYYHHHDHQTPILDFSHQSSSISCNNTSSTSDEADEDHMSIINERKRRRMISNRESARRSRMRKQKQLDELCKQVLSLSDEKYGLINKLNHFSEIHQQVVRENDRLKKETMELKQLLSEAQLANTYTNLRDLEEDNQEVVGSSCTIDQTSNKPTVITYTSSRSIDIFIN